MRRAAAGAAGFAGLAIIGTVVAALRTYRDWRRWHWLTFAAFLPALVAAGFAIGRLAFGTGTSSIWISVACATTVPSRADLARLRAWGPGRIVAWSVVVMGLLAILVFAVVPEA